MDFDVIVWTKFVGEFNFGMYWAIITSIAVYDIPVYDDSSIPPRLFPQGHDNDRHGCRQDFFPKVGGNRQKFSSHMFKLLKTFFLLPYSIQYIRKNIIYF
jgi:hypothetical protein